MKKAKDSITEIMTITGCARSTIYLVWNRWKYAKGDKDKTFAVHARGKKYGERRTLSLEQEKQIQKKMVDKCPGQLKLDFALWTREAVRQLIKQEYGIEMPIRTAGEYLKRWGFTPQRPLRYAYERDPQKVKEWMETTYPMLKSRAKKEGADIYWGDETTITARDVRGRGFAPKGQAPVITALAKHENISMVSAITNQGKVRWMLTEGSVNAEKFTDFIKRLMKNAPNKIFLILDNAKVHHNKELTGWVNKRNDKIEFFYLPAYSHDLNPDEHINADVKQGVGSKVPVKTKEKSRQATEEHMQMLKKIPQRIVKYFKDPAISYASIDV
jgi:transposase